MTPPRRRCPRPSARSHYEPAGGCASNGMSRPGAVRSSARGALVRCRGVTTLERHRCEGPGRISLSPYQRQAMVPEPPAHRPAYQLGVDMATDVEVVTGVALAVHMRGNQGESGRRHVTVPSDVDDVVAGAVERPAPQPHCPARRPTSPLGSRPLA